MKNYFLFISSVSDNDPYCFTNAIKKWYHKWGIKCFHILFDCDGFSVTDEPYSTVIFLNSKFNDKTLRDWIRLLSPKIIHIISERYYTEYIKIAYGFRIPVICGFHGLNPEILEDFKKINEYVDNTRLYSTSQYIIDVIQNFINKQNIHNNIYNNIYNNIQLIHPVYPIGEIKQIKYESYDKKNKFITCLNSSKKRGIDIVYEIVNDLYDLPFIVCSDISNNYNNDEDEYSDKIKKLLWQKGDGSVFLNSASSRYEIYQCTRLLLIPSIVDETAYNIVYEALAVGIPVITTGTGDIKNIMGDSAIILPSDSKKWIEKIKEIYADDEYLNRVSFKMRDIHNSLSNIPSERNFKILVESSTRESKDNNILYIVGDNNMFDKLYYRTLNSKFTTYILHDESINIEWNTDRVYMCKNISEVSKSDLSNSDLLEFTREKNIGKCVFSKGNDCIRTLVEYLYKNGTDIYYIPNEIIESELYLYKNYNVLSKNLYYHDSLSRLGFKKSFFIGCSIYNDKTEGGTLTGKEKENGVIESEEIVFLIINSSREILQQFVNFIRNNKLSNWKIIAHVSTNTSNVSKSSHGLSVFTAHKFLSVVGDDQLETLRGEATVTIDVSDEYSILSSLIIGVPVITFERAPYNEIIGERNGWYCRSNKTEGLYQFDKLGLDEILYKFKNGEYDCKSLRRENIITEYNKTYSYKEWSNRFFRVFI